MPEEFVVSANGGDSLVRFGTFEADLRSGELRRNGAPSGAAPSSPGYAAGETGRGGHSRRVARPALEL